MAHLSSSLCRWSLVRWSAFSCIIYTNACGWIKHYRECAIKAEMVHVYKTRIAESLQVFFAHVELLCYSIFLGAQFRIVLHLHTDWIKDWQTKKKRNAKSKKVQKKALVFIVCAIETKNLNIASTWTTTSMNKNTSWYNNPATAEETSH